MTSRESARIDALRAYEVLDTLPEEAFDRVTALAADLFDAPIALVSLIDAERQWFKSRQGLEAVQTPRSMAFCDHAIRLPPASVMVVPDAQRDPRFSENPLVTGHPDIRFYAGAVLTTPDGFNIGTLCVIDTKAREKPSERDLARLVTLAAIVVDELELSRVDQAARRSQQTLDLAEGMSGVGRWRLYVEDGRVEWSDEVYRIHGLTRETFDPNLDEVVAFYHPEDRPLVSAYVGAAIADGTDFSFRLRLNRQDGQTRIVVCKAMCSRGPAGHVQSVFGVFQDITESQRTIDKAQANEARYRLLADSMADVVTRIRLDGSSSYISPAIEQLLGYRPREMAGKSSLAFVHPDDHALILAAFADLVGGAQRRTLAHRAVRKDGTIIWVETSFQAVVDDTGAPTETVAVIRDVTERRALEAALADSELRYRTLADNSSDILVRFGRDGLVRYVSPSCRSLGVDPETAIGQSVLTLIAPDHLANSEAIVAALFANADIDRAVRREHRVVGKNGAVVWLEGNPQVIRDENGEPVEIVSVLRDVSARRAAEEALVEARRVAEASTEAKSQFLANMSHELRTPLTSIIGFSGLLNDHGGLPEAAAKYAARINSAGQGLLALINDVLDFSKLEEGGIVLDPHPCAIAEVIEDVRGLLSVQAGAKSLSLTSDIGPDVPGWVMLDELRLRQVLQNLIGNAVKFTSQGSVRISLRSRGPDRLRVEVADTGPGVSAEQQVRLFERFTQADASITRQYGGSGLGLSICRELVGLMGGEIGVNSAAGKGSTFWFEIGAAAATAPSPEPVSEEASLSLLSDVRILVVDDHEHNRALVSALLSPLGVEVLQAAGGAEAIEACLTIPFDLVLMDVQMPGMDGRLATAGIRASCERNARTPIIALTAMNASSRAEDLFAAGMNDIVSKPIDPAALISAVCAWIDPVEEEARHVV